MMKVAKGTNSSSDSILTFHSLVSFSERVNTSPWMVPVNRTNGSLDDLIIQKRGIMWEDRIDIYFGRPEGWLP